MSGSPTSIAGLGLPGLDVTVAIEEEGPVPIHGNLDQVGGAIAKRAGLGDDVGLRARELPAMERTRIAVKAKQGAVCLICCHISTPPVAAKFVNLRLRRNYSPEIP